METEIKLRIGPEGLDALARYPAFGDHPADERHEITTYFDTPEFTLTGHGYSLRIRADGMQRIQTLKSAGNGLDVVFPTGAFQRGEWEHPVTGETPDLAALAGTPAAEALQSIGPHALHPVFVTDIHRCSRKLQLPNGAVVEAALDRGTIEADGLSAPVSELELELKQGETGALFRLAIELAGSVPLVLEPLSKADRGLHLRGRAGPSPRTAAPIAFDPEAGTAAAFRAIISSALAHFVRNMAAARDGDAEGVHQLRVATRRLRAALMLFRPHLRGKAAAGFNDELRRIGRICGAARDLDVFLHETLPAARKHVGEEGWLDLLEEVAAPHRGAAQAELRRELDGPACTRLILGLSGWIEDGLTDPTLLGDEVFQRPIAGIDLLSRMERKVAKQGRGIGHASAADLHELRKAIKKLRYSIEFLAPLYG
ncbi:MAG: CHAD domain-containing protein, partial [Acetobacteraceae bacterium]